jgi:hypothetical protein
MAVLYGVVTYITPFWTIGVFSKEPSREMPVWKIFRTVNCDTFAGVMLFRVEYRWFASFPP